MSAAMPAITVALIILRIRFILVLSGCALYQFHASTGFIDLASYMALNAEPQLFVCPSISRSSLVVVYVPSGSSLVVISLPAMVLDFLPNRLVSVLGKNIRN